MRVLENTVRGAQLSGLHLAPGTANVRMTGNTALDSGSAPRENGFDCHDESAAGSGTAGRSNTWSGNAGRTSSPLGLCAASGGDLDRPGRAGKGDAKQGGKRHGKHRAKRQRPKQRPSDPCSCGLLFPRRI